MPTKFFGTVRPKIFAEKTWYPVLCIKFFDTPNFLKHWSDAHEIFRHCETKNFRRKNVITPLSSIKLFEARNFLKNSKIPLRNFSALWDIKISTESRDMPPFIHYFFRYQKFYGKQKGSFRKIFVSVLWDKKFRQNRDAPPPPLLCMKIFNKRIFLKHQSVLQWNFLVQSDKNFSRESRDTPPPLLPIKYFFLQKFSKTQNGSLANFFRSCEIIFFDKTVKLPPSFAWKFSIPEFFRNTEGFSYEFYRHCETKNIERKVVVPLLLHKT